MDPFAAISELATAGQACADAAAQPTGVVSPTGVPPAIFGSSSEVLAPVKAALAEGEKANLSAGAKLCAKLIEERAKALQAGG